MWSNLSAKAKASSESGRYKTEKNHMSVPALISVGTLSVGTLRSEEEDICRRSKCDDADEHKIQKKPIIHKYASSKNSAQEEPSSPGESLRSPTSCFIKERHQVRKTQNQEDVPQVLPHDKDCDAASSPSLNLLNDPNHLPDEEFFLIVPASQERKPPLSSAPKKFRLAPRPSHDFHTPSSSSHQANQFIENAHLDFSLCDDIIENNNTSYISVDGIIDSINTSTVSMSDDEDDFFLLHPKDLPYALSGSFSSSMMENRSPLH